MKYVFNRTYVGQGNQSFYRGSEVPADFPKDTLEKLVLDGLIGTVETPGEFMTKVVKTTKKGEAKVSEVQDSVEKLDPDKKPRSE